jgi:hypothetical protein
MAGARIWLVSGVGPDDIDAEEGGLLSAATNAQISIAKLLR